MGSFLSPKQGQGIGGAALGGLLVGVCESAYRDVSVLYGALLYGAAWTVAAMLVFALAQRPLRGTRLSAFALGLASTVGVSTFVLGRFVVRRDFLAESPGSAITATLLGLLAATSLAWLAWHGTSWATSRVPDAARRWAWLLPAATLLAFAGLALRGDDDLPQAPIAPKPQPQPGRGVILVVADTLRADALGAYGAPPHRAKPASAMFDGLAARGQLFDNMSAQASWTKPAVASIMTSRHVSGHHTMAKTATLPESLPTIASVLQKAGIFTAAVVTNFNLEADFGFARGFDDFRYLPPARYLGAPPRANRLALYNAYRVAREKLLRSWRQADNFYRSGDVVNAAAMDILDRVGERPFFVWLHYMEPHDPYFNTQGQSWARVSQRHPDPRQAPAMRAAYKDEVQRFDAALGGLLRGLAQRGRTETTTVIVMADHGEEFAEHGGFYHGTSLYEEQLAVPLLVAGPSVAAGVNSTLVRQLDIAPTVSALLNVTPPPSWEGRNLLDPRTEPPAGTLAEEDHEGHRLVAFRRAADDTKLIVANADNPRGLAPQELYDLTTDSDEQSPLSSSSAAVSLKRAMANAQRAAARGAAESKVRALDQDAEAALKSLGYVR